MKALLLLFCLLLPMTTRAAQLYITSAGGQNQGIYLCRVDENSGTLSEPEQVAELEKPAYLAFSPNGLTLYAIHETTEGSALSAFAREPASGKLRLLGSVPTGGRGACHVSVDAAGATALVAHYSGGSVAAFALEAGGGLTPKGAPLALTGSSQHPRRQLAPHPHFIAPAPGHPGLAYSADLGADRIRLLRVGSTLEETAAAATPPGSGPRHLAFGPSTLYACNEMGVSVSAFAIGADGTLALRETRPSLPPDTDLKGVTTAAIRLHPSGSPLYVSNRGAGLLTLYPIGAEGQLGEPTTTPAGSTSPWDIAFTPKSGYLAIAGREDDRVLLLPLEGPSHQPGAPVAQAPLGKPGCVVFAPVAKE